MKLSEQLLHEAMNHFEILCSPLILKKELKPTLKRLIYHLTDARIIYLQYNNHHEYSYSIVYSRLEQDFCRFDNYDKQWDVITSPHHFHQRRKYHPVASPMNGNPLHDMTELCSFLKKNDSD